jgi:phospholipid-binding lipoprotein MlaA
MKPSARPTLALAAACLLLCTGCASLAGGPPGDPLEPLNRRIFGFNEQVQARLVAPVSRTWLRFTSEAARDGVHHFMRNLGSPVTLVNDLLQGELRRAGVTFARFLVNSTLGVGGVYEMGEAFGLEHHDEDFGQTLAVWGVPPGPYLVLPLLGSSSPRAGAGMAVDSWLSPWGFVIEQPVRIGLAALDAIDSYARVMDRLDGLRETSVDYYATIRSLYLQDTEQEVRNGRDAEAEEPTGIDYDVDLSGGGP